MRLTLLACLLALAACGDAGGGVIEDNVIRPGVTAMDDASQLACNADRAALTTALEAFEMLQGEPAIDQTALVQAGFLREGSSLYEVVDGEIRPVDPGCS